MVSIHPETRFIIIKGRVSIKIFKDDDYSASFQYEQPKELAPKPPIKINNDLEQEGSESEAEGEGDEDLKLSILHETKVNQYYEDENDIANFINN